MLSDKKPSCGQLLGPTESGQPRQFNETVDDPALGWAWKIDVRLAPTSGAKATFPDRCFVPGSGICSAAKLQPIRSPRRRLKTSFALLVTLPTPISLYAGGGANVAATRTGNEVER